VALLGATAATAAGFLHELMSDTSPGKMQERGGDKVSTPLRRTDAAGPVCLANEGLNSELTRLLQVPHVVLCRTLLLRCGRRLTTAGKRLDVRVVCNTGWRVEASNSGGS
jgi:hypothetical protein